MEAQEKMTLKKAVKIAVESFRPGETFGGYELKERVVALYPHCKNCYVDTILRQARDVARDKYKCIDTRRSIYERIGEKADAVERSRIDTERRKGQNDIEHQPREKDALHAI